MTTFGESCIIGMLLGEFKGILLCIFAVEAYTASWIEILSQLSETAMSFVEAYTASWIEIPERLFSGLNQKVEAYTASWIEIYMCNSAWNEDTVEAYTASWIEISVPQSMKRRRMSRLIQPRGLKYNLCSYGTAD